VLEPAALVAVHGERVGQKFEMRRTQLTIGGGASDHVRLDGLAPCVARLDRMRDHWAITRLAKTLDVAVDGRSTHRAPLSDGAELWIGNNILRLVADRPEVYHEAVFRLARIDAVTGVANRRFFLALAERERLWAHSRGTPLCVAWWRLAGFRELVALHGQAVGNRLLRAVASRLQLTTGERPLGRLHGWTFGALLEGTADARYPVVDALRRAIAEIEVDTLDGDARLDACAAVGDVIASTELQELETRAFARIEQAEDAGDRSPIWLE